MSLRVRVTENKPHTTSRTQLKQRNNQPLLAQQYDDKTRKDARTYITKKEPNTTSITHMQWEGYCLFDRQTSSKDWISNVWNILQNFLG